MCKVIQEDAGLEEAVLELLALGGAVQLGEVVGDEVLVRVGGHARIVLDAPFGRREAAHPCCFARVDEVALDGVVGVEVDYEEGEADVEALEVCGEGGEVVVVDFLVEDAWDRD